MKKIILLIFILIISIFTYRFYSHTNTLTWTSINVSNSVQGDAHLISKNDTHYLIDTGSHAEDKVSLIPYLKSQGVETIEAIVITHPHFDHYGGVVTILESNITVHTIYMNMPTEQQMASEPWGGQYKHLVYIQKMAKKYNTKVLTIKAGDTLSFDKKSFIDVLYAYDGLNTPVGNTDINDMSIIMMIHDDKNRFLLTGDLNQKLGTYLASHAKDIKADILKAPHHGGLSLAPDIFFQKVAPTVLIVPTTQALWCSDRCKRVRELAQKESYTTYINGFHGHITVTSHDNKTIIRTEKSPSEICKEVK